MKSSVFAVSLFVAVGALPACGGEDGKTGPAGPEGAAGPAGEAGDRGATGDRGDPGDDGEPGEDGARGPRGPAGENGEPGATGATGATGPSGLDYASTVLVSPDGTALENGAALIAAIGGISENSQTNPMLVKIEPGHYDLGDDAIFLKDFVDIEGSGEGVTFITSSNTVFLSADHVEVRSLTVATSGSATFQTAVGIYTDTVDFRMTNVTASSEGSGMFAYAVSGHGVFKNVTLVGVGTGSAQGAGIFDNSNSTSTFIGSSLTGSTYSAWIQSGAMNLANTQLVGPTSGSSMTCVACYDGSFAPLDSSCQ